MSPNSTAAAPTPAQPVPALKPQAHWQKVYSEKASTGMSWYQEVPTRSLKLIESFGEASEVEGVKQPLRVIDVGGGASALADNLLQQPDVEVCLVDIAAKAIELSRERLGAEGAAHERKGRVRWVEADATGPMEAIADGWADVWHDRAVFHFLMSKPEQLAYASNMARILRPGGTAIVAGFSPDGPERCSGLPVQRRDAAAIAAELSVAGRAFKLVDSYKEEHKTPWGTVQAFVYAVLKG
ncbi:MAG: class I SAM-dependent methyltransferase [Phycisphaerales bacterium]|nr:class I SAM-dependent methyltransferase [Phycisphaerales bacterium]